MHQVGRDNTHDLRTVIFNETSIVAELDQALSGFPSQADEMSFRMNRISDAVEVNYLRGPENLLRMRRQHLAGNL